VPDLLQKQPEYPTRMPEMPDYIAGQARLKIELNDWKLDA
jgi:hypothetical protein